MPKPPENDPKAGAGRGAKRAAPRPSLSSGAPNAPPLTSIRAGGAFHDAGKGQISEEERWMTREWELPTDQQPLASEVRSAAPWITPTLVLPEQEGSPLVSTEEGANDPLTPLAGMKAAATLMNGSPSEPHVGSGHKEDTEDPLA